jgi:hypothetical protein
MADGMGGGDNYVGSPNDMDWDSWSPDQLVGGDTPLEGGERTQQGWLARLAADPKTLAQLNSLRTGLGTLKTLPDPNAAAARPAMPAPSLHQGQSSDALAAQSLQILRQRQQQYRSQFLPKTAGLLGG